jgi:nucleotidyltransferase substrate binding protein (TIGR01987 family)
MTPEIRWKQRFSNYERSFNELSQAVARGSYDKLSQAGLIQMFELTFELAWKTLKDKLEYDGLKANSPRETIKLAFQNNYIRNGEIWIEALDNRNLLAHTYDEAKSNEARDLIRGKYFFLLKDLHEFLKKDSK